MCCLNYSTDLSFIQARNPLFYLLSLNSLLSYVRICCLNTLKVVSKAAIPFWVVMSIVSLILPPIAKAKRLENDGRGGGMEVFGLVLGGFAFYSVIFALTRVSLYFGYLGWIISGIIYRSVS